MILPIVATRPRHTPASMSPHQPEGQAWDDHGRLRAELAEPYTKRPLAVYRAFPSARFVAATVTQYLPPSVLAQADREATTKSALAEMRMGAGILSLMLVCLSAPCLEHFLRWWHPTLLSTDILERLLAG